LSSSLDLLDSRRSRAIDDEDEVEDEDVEWM
jgi:hypothetical protein